MLFRSPGTTANFSVSASGTALSYQWYNGTSLLAGQTNNALSLAAVTSTNAGSYSVVVSGTCGASVTNSASLVVNQNVLIVTAPVDQTSFVGSNATFTVQASGTGLNYQWIHNGEQVGAGTDLVLNNLTTSSAGSYCIVVGGLCGGPVTNCANLTILNRAPTVEIITPTNQSTFVVGQPISIVANAADPDGPAGAFVQT